MLFNGLLKQAKDGLHEMPRFWCRAAFGAVILV